MTVFREYADWYDLFYADKDYRGEVAYVHRLLRDNGAEPGTLLEIGCGTGAHAELFIEQGWSVTGVDLSEEMLSRARSRFDNLSAGIRRRGRFLQGDARTLDLGERFDGVVALFHVMSYQSGQDDLGLAIATARRHLQPGGVFIFDFWYGPTVLTQLPEARLRKVENARTVVRRFATPHLKANENIVEVHYDFVVSDKSGSAVEELSEIHRMRYLFLPEIRQLALACGFKKVEAFDWLSNDPPSRGSWNACAVLSLV